MASRRIWIIALLNLLVAGGYSAPNAHNVVKRGSITSYCSQNVIIRSQADADAISNCSTLKSLLTVLAPGNISLPNLVVLHGDLVINSSSALVNFAADSLTQIIGRSNYNGLVVDSAPLLQSLSFKDLAVIAGQVYINNVPALGSVSLPALQAVAQRVLVAKTGLEGLSLPSFKHTAINDNKIYDINDYSSPAESWGVENPNGYAAGLAVASNPALSELYVPSLKNITGGLFIKDNMELKSLAFPHLTNIAYSGAYLNGTFKSLSFPSLVQINYTLMIKTTDEKYDCVDFGPLETKCQTNAPFGSIASPITSSGGSQNDLGFPVLSSGAVTGVIVASVIAFIMSIMGCYCCCCRNCSNERKERTKLETATRDQVPGYELQPQGANGSPTTGWRVGVDEAFDAPPVYSTAAGIVPKETPPQYRRAD